MSHVKSLYSKGKSKMKYVASYEKVQGDRMFVLVHPATGKRLEFTSPQAAIKAGFHKVN